MTHSSPTVLLAECRRGERRFMALDARKGVLIPMRGESFDVGTVWVTVDPHKQEITDCYWQPLRALER